MDKRPFPVNQYTPVPLSDIMTPKDGYVCYAHSWWLVRDNDTVFFTMNRNNRRHDHPCCNPDKRLFDRWELQPGYEPKLLAMVYLDRQN